MAVLDPLIVHVHMPKAGGMTLAEILRSIYGDRLLFANPRRGWPPEWSAELLADMSAKRDYYRAFSSHCAFGIHKIFERPAVYFSSVRDPIERFESYYNFVRHWTIHHHHQAAQGLSIGGFFRYLRDRDDIELFNLQCLLLCGHKDFQKARESVTAHYLAVIPLSSFVHSIEWLARQLSWPSITIPRLNVTEHKAKTDELTREDLNALAEGNAADANLVKFCEDRTAYMFDH